jgi:hypothetical protein
MPFRVVNRILETLLFGGRHVLVGLRCIQSIRVATTIRKDRTYMGIKEERVRSPREGFSTHVEVIIIGRERGVPIILSLEVFHVLGVLRLNFLHPEVTSPNCFPRVNSNIAFGKNETSLAGRKAKVEADLTPEVGGVWREIG